MNLKTTWWLVCAVIAVHPATRAQGGVNCPSLMPQLVTVTKQNAGAYPLLAPAFQDVLDLGLSPRDSFLKFFDAHPGIGQRLSAAKGDLDLRVIPTSPLENTLLLVGQRLHEGVSMEYGDLQLKFVASTGELLSLTFKDTAGWTFESSAPLVPADDAARIALEMARHALGGGAEIQAVPALYFTALPSKEFVLAWKVLVIDRRSSFDGRILSISARTGEVLFIGPALGDAGVPDRVRFIRGDTDADGEVNLTDAVTVLNALFRGSPAEPPCIDAADANADQDINISDAVYTLQYLFAGAKAPPEPFPGCGIPLDGLGCRCYPSCR